MPVIKVATRSDLARRWHDLMDINAGTFADGSATIEAEWRLTVSLPAWPNVAAMAPDGSELPIAARDEAAPARR